MQAINNLAQIKTRVSDKDFQINLYKQTQAKRYLVILEWQIDKISDNLNTIDCLINKEYIEDAYTIFRKMLETFFLVESVLVNPQVARTYIIHEDKLSKKVMNNYRTDEIKVFVEGKPDGYLEYGFVEQLVDTSEEGFKYTIKTVANAAGVGDLYKWYRITSNFVHNNLTQFKINKPDLSTKLITMCDTITKKLLDTINNY